MKITIRPRDITSLLSAKRLIEEHTKEITSNEVNDSILDQVISNCEAISEIDYLISLL